MGSESQPTPNEGSGFIAGTNEYASLGEAVTSTPETKGIIRSARDLEAYKRIFGEDFGRREELILDMGAGDATMADEIESLSDHKAKVVRLDRDYASSPPSGEAPAIAADATRMPFASGSFDRIVSHSMMYYLGRDKGTSAVSEMLRVLKDGGEAILYPANPLKSVNTEVARKERNPQGALAEPNLVINKPEGFDSWDEDRKEEAVAEIARAVTLGKIGTKLIHWGIARSIQRAGTHRTVEQGNSHSLKPFKRA